jgi:hypothetical protein
LSRKGTSASDRAALRSQQPARDAISPGEWVAPQRSLWDRLHRPSSCSILTRSIGISERIIWSVRCRPSGRGRSTQLTTRSSIFQDRQPVAHVQSLRTGTCTARGSQFMRTQTQPTPDPPYALPHTRVRTAAHSLWNGGGPELTVCISHRVQVTSSWCRELGYIPKRCSVPAANGGNARAVTA